jgi:hypothetical protein
MTKSKALPPDEALQRLAKIINAKLPDGAMVNFYRLEEPMRTGMVFSFGVHRHNEVKAGAPGEDSVDQIVQLVKDWIANNQPASKWTEDQIEADSLDWNR